MSTRRQMKKESQRSEALGHRLEDLYRRGADDAFLDLVHERCRSLPELPAASLHGEVVDRMLRRTLAAGDWHQTGRILKRLRRDVVGGRPMVRLADAALHLVEGRLDEARAGFAGLNEEGNGASPVSACLLTALQALTAPSVPGDQNVWELARRLELLREQGFRATPPDIRSFEVILAALEVGVAGDTTSEKLLKAARERLRLLDTLDALDGDLRRDLENGMERILGPFLEQAVKWWAALSLVLPATPPWNLVRPFHHALRLTWRRLLQTLADNEGSEAWATLIIMKSGFIDLDLENGAGAKNNATEAGRLWREWSDHFHPGRFRKLAEFLESKSRTEKDPERLADLWDAELIAWQWAPAIYSGERGETSTSAEIARGRLTRWTAELGRRISPAHQSAVACRLRPHLLWVMDLEDPGRWSLNVATSLLAYREEDPVLLAAALVSAASVGDLQERDRFAGRISASGVVAAEDRPEILNVMSQTFRQAWPGIVQDLSRLRPLLESGDWEEIARDARQEILAGMLQQLTPWEEDHLPHLRRDLEAVRADMPDLLLFDALEVTLRCLDSEDDAALREVRSFLEKEPGLEAALALFLMLDRALTARPQLLPGLLTGLSEARIAVIDRLDLRWSLWRGSLLDLFDEAAPEEAHRLKERLYLLLDREDLEVMESEVIQNAVGQIDRWQENERRRAEKWAREERSALEESDESQEEPEDDDDVDWDQDDWEDDDEDTKEYPLPEVTREDLTRVLERLFPPPHLVMKPLEPVPGPLQSEDLQPLLRPMRKRAVEEALRAGLAANRP